MRAFTHRLPITDLLVHRFFRLNAAVYHRRNAGGSINLARRVGRRFLSSEVSSSSVPGPVAEAITHGEQGDKAVDAPLTTPTEAAAANLSVPTGEGAAHGGASSSERTTHAEPGDRAATGTDAPVIPTPTEAAAAAYRSMTAPRAKKEATAALTTGLPDKRAVDQYLAASKADVSGERGGKSFPSTEDASTLVRHRQERKRDPAEGALLPMQGVDGSDGATRGKEGNGGLSKAPDTVDWAAALAAVGKSPVLEFEKSDRRQRKHWRGNLLRTPAEEAAWGREAEQKMQVGNELERRLGSTSRKVQPARRRDGESEPESRPSRGKSRDHSHAGTSASQEIGIEREAEPQKNARLGQDGTPGNEKSSARRLDVTELDLYGSELELKLVRDKNPPTSARSHSTPVKPPASRSATPNNPALLEEFYRAVSQNYQMSVWVLYPQVESAGDAPWLTAEALKYVLYTYKRNGKREPWDRRDHVTFLTKLWQYYTATGTPPDIGVYQEFIYFFARLQSPTMVDRVLQTASENKILFVDRYGELNLMLCYAHMGQFSAARLLLDQFLEHHLKRRAAAAYMQGCTAGNHEAEIVKVFAELNDKWGPDDVLFFELIHFYVKNLNISKVLALFEQRNAAMKKPARQDMFNIVIHACEEAGRHATAAELRQKMKPAETTPLPNSTSPPVPNLDGTIPTPSDLVQRAKLVSAWLQIKKRGFKHLRVRTDTNLAVRLVHAMDNKTGTLSQLSQTLLQAGLHVGIATLRVLLTGFSQVGNGLATESVLGWFNQCGLKAFREDWNAVLSAYASTGDVVNAVRVRQQMRDTGVQVQPETLVQLVILFRVEGMMSRAKEALAALRGQVQQGVGTRKARIFLERKFGAADEIVKALRELEMRAARTSAGARHAESLTDVSSEPAKTLGDISPSQPPDVLSPDTSSSEPEGSLSDVSSEPAKTSCDLSISRLAEVSSDISSPGSLTSSSGADTPPASGTETPISLTPARPTTTAGPESITTITKPIPERYLDLITVLYARARDGQKQPRRSQVGVDLTRRNPMLFKRASGPVNFSQYTKGAEALGLVALGGESGAAWIALGANYALCEELAGNLSDPSSEPAETVSRSQHAETSTDGSHPEPTKTSATNVPAETAADSSPSERADVLAEALPLQPAETSTDGSHPERATDVPAETAADSSPTEALAEASPSQPAEPSTDVSCSESADTRADDPAQPAADIPSSEQAEGLVDTSSLKLTPDSTIGSADIPPIEPTKTFAHTPGETPASSAETAKA